MLRPWRHCRPVSSLPIITVRMPNAFLRTPQARWRSLGARRCRIPPRPAPTATSSTRSASRFPRPPARRCARFTGRKKASPARSSTFLWAGSPRSIRFTATSFRQPWPPNTWWPAFPSPTRMPPLRKFCAPCGSKAPRERARSMPITKPAASSSNISERSTARTAPTNFSARISSAWSNR